MDFLKQLYEAFLQSYFFRIVVILFVILFVLRLVFKKGVKIYSESEMLFNLSRKLHCSEYDIFKYAAKAWSFSDKKVEDDFKRYLSSGEIPRYVIDYIKKRTLEEES